MIFRYKRIPYTLQYSYSTCSPQCVQREYTAPKSHSWCIASLAGTLQPHTRQRTRLLAVVVVAAVVACVIFMAVADAASAPTEPPASAAPVSAINP